MARKKRTESRAAPQSRDQYSMALSRERLEREGFHTQAWGQNTVHDTMDSWKSMVRKQLDRPPAHTHAWRMTRAFLLLCEERAAEEEPVPQTPGESQFEKMITAQSVGPLILNHVFATGHRSSLHLALASKRLWAVLAGSVNYFDFYAGRLQNLGPSGIFLSVTPEFTLQEMMTTRLTDPYGFKSATPFTDWHNAAISREEDILKTLFLVRQRLRAEEKKVAKNKTKRKKSRNKAENGTENEALAQPIPAFLNDIFNPDILKAILAIKNLDEIFKANQFISLASYRVFEPQMIYAATRLQLLLIQVYNQRKNTRVLHFHQTPFFDRRVLAIVLRACPHVTMLGVYNCPLIHLGDLIPLLDLIHEINEERRLRNAPLISAFDFYPSFRAGLTVSEGQAPIYGLTADSLDLDIVQRGLYAILLKGFLKARHMKLGLLFEPGQALKAFLFRLPNPPLSVPAFFDGLCRYLQSGASVIQKRQALFDLTKPIRLGLEPNLDNESWYQEEMGRYLPFCSSCGYEMLYEMFPTGTRRVYPHRRVCAACSLQDLLDREPHDMRDWKIGLLARLMPTWDGKVFNKDAPTDAHASDLMRLPATATLPAERPSPLYIRSDGELAATHHVLPLRRDNKSTADSLQNLPSLRALVEADAEVEARWADLFNHCTKADVYARARRRLLAEARKELHRGEWDKKHARTPRDGNGEVWRRPRHAREVQSFDYTSAAQFQMVLDVKGW